MKNKIMIAIAFVLGGIVFSGITAYAVIKVSATEIGYNNTTVADQLDSLYQTMFSDNYSTTERQVGKWIDGKPLYQKTIKTTKIPNNNIEYIDLDTSGIDEIAYINAFIHSVNDTYTTLTRVNDASSDSLYGTVVSYDIDVSNDRIQLKGRHDNFTSMFDYAVFTIQYTKTASSQTNQ